MNLVVDYGNSAAKVGIFDNENLMEKHTFSDEDALLRYLNKLSVEHLIVSSVKTDAQQIIKWVNHNGLSMVLNYRLPLPIKNLYSTPETLGVDRLAAVCGARQLFENENCLVIDAGTCITFDVLDKHGRYFGGAISPGLNMRFQALNTFTAKLPLITPVENPRLIGTSTESCIHSGVINGLIAELNGIIDQYEAKYDDLQVLLCGGDTHFFEKKLKASIFASPELVLVGLNSILIYNVTH
ncbi:MAG TPA: type III pantothenate kinase [Chryseosolibacter sp.]|nr:type III pantothenate kinase [Chryseosolibacter sp.]